MDFFFPESILTLRKCIFTSNPGLRPSEMPTQMDFFFPESILTLRIGDCVQNPGLRPSEEPTWMNTAPHTPIRHRRRSWVKFLIVGPPAVRFLSPSAASPPPPPPPPVPFLNYLLTPNYLDAKQKLKTKNTTNSLITRVGN